MNIFVPVPLWTWTQVSLGCIPGVDYWILFISSKYAQIALNGCASVYSHQQCARVPIFLYITLRAGLPLILPMCWVKSWAALHILANSDLAFNDLYLYFIRTRKTFFFLVSFMFLGISKNSNRNQNPELFEWLWISAWTRKCFQVVPFPTW